MNGKNSEESDMFKLVRMIMQRNFDPVSGNLHGQTQLHAAGACTFG